MSQITEGRINRPASIKSSAPRISTVHGIAVATPVRMRRSSSIFESRISKPTSMTGVLNSMTATSNDCALHILHSHPFLLTSTNAPLVRYISKKPEKGLTDDNYSNRIEMDRSCGDGLYADGLCYPHGRCSQEACSRYPSPG